MKMSEIILEPGQQVFLDGGIGIVKSVQMINCLSMPNYQRAYVEWIVRKESQPNVFEEEARSSYFGFEN